MAIADEFKMLEPYSSVALHTTVISEAEHPSTLLSVKAEPMSPPTLRVPATVIPETEQSVVEIVPPSPLYPMRPPTLSPSRLFCQYTPVTALPSSALTSHPESLAYPSPNIPPTL